MIVYDLHSSCLSGLYEFEKSAQFWFNYVQFKDLFGCGAFFPTWTYVCCSTLEKLEDDWKPKPDLWFYPVGFANAQNIDISAPFPVLLPWPGYQDSEITPDITVSGILLKSNITVIYYAIILVY